jgi:hypothetical protein
LNAWTIRPVLRRLLHGEGDARAVDDTHDIRFVHDREVLAIELALGARPVVEPDAVAMLDLVRRLVNALLAPESRALRVNPEPVRDPAHQLGLWPAAVDAAVPQPQVIR